MTKKQIITLPGFERTGILQWKKPYGEKWRLTTDVHNGRKMDFTVLKSLPERFINPRNPEHINLDSFKTRTRQYFMLNGQLLDVNHANKDVVSKVVYLLNRMKKDMPHSMGCFIDNVFLDKMVGKKSHPVKESLKATGNFFKNVGKGFITFVFK